MRSLYFFLTAVTLHAVTSDSAASELIVPKVWQPVVIQADFIGTVHCETRSYKEKWFGGRLLLECTVVDAIKGPGIGTKLTLDLGPSRNQFGGSVPSAKKGQQFFVVAYCRWSSNAPIPPADYFLTAYETRSWAPLPWSSTQMQQFLQLHGSRHSSLEKFVEDARALLSLSPEQQEYASIMEALEDALDGPRSSSNPDDLTDSEKRMRGAKTIPEIVEALLSSNLDRELAKEVLLAAAGPASLAIIKNGQNPNIRVGPEFMRNLEREVDFRWSSCSN